MKLHSWSNLMQTKVALIVDDQQEVRESLRAALQSRGWQVHEAYSAMKAIALWPFLTPKPNVLVSDLRMESLNAGMTLARELTRDNPELNVVIISGFLTGLENIPDHYSYLRKPFEMEEFCSLLDRLVEPQQP